MISGSKPNIARLSANKDLCERVKEKIKKDSRLADLAFHLRPSCKNCEFNDPSRCKLQSILKNDNDILGLTYAKLKIIRRSKSQVDSEILGKLKSADNLVLDEFTTGVITTAPSIPIVNPCACLDNEFDLFKDKPIRHISEAEARFRKKIPEFAMYANFKAEKLKEKSHEIYENPLSAEDREFFDDNSVECWKTIERLTIEGRDTKLLQGIFGIISSRMLLVNKKDGNVRISPVEDLEDQSVRGSRYLRDYMQEFFSEKKLTALVDACLPDLDFTKTLGLTVSNYLWGDPLNTNKSQMLICDTSKIGVIEFFKKECQNKLKSLINFASYIHSPSRILIVTLNKSMAKEVSKWKNAKEEKERIPKSIEVTYYRSELSRGITIDPRHRILILIGAPYLPKVAYLAETYKTDMLTAFRKSDMKSAFVNLIGRVKDSKGLEKSVVYAIGITAEEVRALVMQKDLRSPLVFKFLVTGADALDFELAANSFLHAHELRKEWSSLEQDLPVLARILRSADTGTSQSLSARFCQTRSNELGSL